MFEWPASPIPGIERVILHWTAGGHLATTHELLSYHILVEHEEGIPDDPSDDKVLVVAGVPLERNAGSVRGKPPAERNPEAGYAAHTRGMNSRSIGLALCGMRGAVDKRPEAGGIGDVDPGPSPITTQQVDVVIGLLVQFCTIWGVLPTEDRVLTHYEAEVRQAGGEPVPGLMDLPDGWYALPMPEDE